MHPMCKTVALPPPPPPLDPPNLVDFPQPRLSPTSPALVLLCSDFPGFTRLTVFQYPWDSHGLIRLNLDPPLVVDCFPQPSLLT